MTNDDGLRIRRICPIISIIVILLESPMMIMAQSASSSFVQSNSFPLRSHPLSFHHRRTRIRTSSSIHASEERSRDTYTHVYLRFSPLVGGPTFLPLHVEVIFAVDDGNSTATMQTHSMDTVYVRNGKSFSSIPLFKESMIFHRFDFLPENPTDPSTLARLFTFQSVPGTVRCRSKPQHQQQDVAVESMSGTDRNGVSILIPFGSLANNKNSNEVDILSTAVRFKDEYSGSLFKEIRLLGGKNCFSFALDLLSYVELNTGLTRVTGLAAVDVK